MNPLENKVIFITGASSGIGRATARQLLEQGARVFDFSRTHQLAEELPHPNLTSFRGDVGQEADVQAAFRLCVETYGGVDVLINNAGLGLPTPDLAETDLDTYERMMNTNVRGVFLCNREALRLMKPRQQGHIVSVISMAGQRTNPGAPLYCASKFGARGLSSGLADQVLKHGIKVTDVNPGPTDSNYWGDRPVAREKFLQADDVARVIAFVLSQPEYVVIREINFDNMKFLAG
ncbi:SDR family oxidoreductase [Hymenobacter arizonensis]|uniref:NADP-dependent 3-hydroxy acid dehydrogenase YdfG n=1 Tax=Hymenobacter arizonensis TaxID=1227077 RepID=A0A1I6BJV5_HYMAR|nr:SDR family oxidoreductase [Hymenobacter arizonensis]SFQ81077.1 NADP-dependent 3-hydroxy acid dehydrogenase YdfG [Hymenobacter arizonensis]